MNIGITTQLLLEAKKLLVEKGWTQNAYARDKYGEETYVDGGYSFCASGALRAAFNMSATRVVEFRDAMKLLDSCAPDYNIMKFNDEQGRTKEEVIAVFDKAIEEAKAKSENNL